MKKGIWIGLLAGMAGFGGLAAPTAETPSPNVALAKQLNDAFVGVAEKVSASVVVVNVTQKPGKFTALPGERDGLDSLPPEIRKYLEKQSEEETPQPEVGQGSGIIIRDDGFILTNGHVVRDAEKIEVRLRDGRTFKAKLRGLDDQSDVAVIKIEADGLPAARLADSSKTRVGEFAIAIGAPFSLDYSVTFGHVSAKSRANVIPFYAGGAAMDQDFIQTDANINPGNSGGPLVNLDGEVIGMNTMIRGLHTGIGFAIPSNLAKEVADQLIAEGKFTRAWLGVEIKALRELPDLKEMIKGISDGVVIAGVLKDGPAAKSDLRATDIITAVEGTAVATPQQLRSEIRGRKIGQPLTLDVYRNGKMLQVKVKPGEWSDASATLVTSNRRAPASENEAAGLGLTVRTLSPELARQFGVKATEGVIVTAVETDTLAARKGLKPGDIITSITNGGTQQQILNLKEFREAVRKADLKKGVIINFQSGEGSRFEILKEGGE